ncbi:lysozyme [Candidatus Uhrbacteria bacterium]|nr:lysozyme [Candidatus Uhrbacteria bacterium]
MGFEKFRPKEYLDQGGKRTIGWGHLLQPGEEYPNGISKDEALRLLAQDIRIAETGVQKKVKVDLVQHQFDALTSLVFTIGRGAFGESTLLRLLNRGEYNKAANEFLEWNKVTREDGVKVPSEGLTKRRKMERNLFLNGKYE